jgi:hypothetical protein
MIEDSLVLKDVLIVKEERMLVEDSLQETLWRLEEARQDFSTKTSIARVALLLPSVFRTDSALGQSILEQVSVSR